MSIEAAPESQQSTSNLRVSEFTPLPTPQDMVAELPLDARLADVVGTGPGRGPRHHGRRR